jgi:hypothetical protein
MGLGIDLLNNAAAVQWQLTFVIFPQRTNSGKLVWLEKAYRGTGTWGFSGRGTPMYCHCWMTVEEFIWSQLSYVLQA